MRSVTRSAAAPWGRWNRRRGSAAHFFGADSRHYEFKLAFFDRLDLCSGGAALDDLSALGIAGWHIVNIRQYANADRSLAVFLQREAD